MIGNTASTTGGVKLYFNSVNLGSGTFAGNTSRNSFGGFGDRGLRCYGLDVRNNIFATNLVNSAASGAKTYAIYSAAANTAYTNINYNDYYVSGTQGVLGFLTSDRTNLAGIISGFGQNANSISGDPKFLSATDLHINTAVTTPIESAGTPIAGVTTDIDNDVRNVTTPDIGADEGTFIAPVTNDVQATAFIDPTNGGSKLAGASFSPSASFTNNGTANQTIVPVRYRIVDAGMTEVYNNTTTIPTLNFRRDGNGDLREHFAYSRNIYDLCKS
ncbi:MAG: hypothetical protein IPK58_19320 [Acidobacteria bacterium]|nr:hypothetical protein [Acidobacteriota bacterium]